MIEDLKEDSKLIGEIIVVSGMGWPSDVVLESVVEGCLGVLPGSVTSGIQTVFNL